jgi:hypothetical protein
MQRKVSEKGANSIKKKGEIRAPQLLLDQSYVQDHVQSYRQDVEQDTRPWSYPTDYTVSLNKEFSTNKHNAALGHC